MLWNDKFYDMLYDVVKIWSGCDLNIYILYIGVMSIVFKNLRCDYTEKIKKYL